MSDQPPTDRPERPTRRERRAPVGAKGSLRWMRSILGRPLGLQRRADGVHLALLERRRPAEVVQADSLVRLREELRLRLLEPDHEPVTVTMCQLVAVHDMLGRKGWAGVQGLKSAVLRLAILQTQQLVQREPSPRLGRFIDRLRMMQAAAEAREERLQAQALVLAAGEALQVSEATAEEFEASQRDWETTLPAALDGAAVPTTPDLAPRSATPDTAEAPATPDAPAAPAATPPAAAARTAAAKTPTPQT